ncbi:MAG: hypothetical protein LBT68_07480 [Spirochaetales bacterium]|jgi:hypothetical protein|nr:hypothetical protein [Spirochaetales bacterium]
MKKYCVYLIILCALFAGCSSGSDDASDLIVQGSFVSQVPESSTSVTGLSVNFGTGSSEIRGTLTETTAADGEIEIPIDGTYDSSQRFFTLSGGAQYLKYYVEGFLDASNQFKDATANIAVKATAVSTGWDWDMKAGVPVTPAP